MRSHTARTAYFAVQRLRGGVSRDMIATAEAYLAQPWPAIRDAVSERLVALHGAEAAGGQWLQQRRLVDRTELAPLLRTQPLPAGVRVEQRKTSGSSGVPFHFPKDIAMSAWMDAAMWAVYGWHGVQPGDRQARFWGTPFDRTAAFRQMVTDRALNRRRLSAFRVDATSSLAFFADLQRFQPRYVYGYPTLIHEFARHCDATGRDGRSLGVRVVFCTGEVLHDTVRQRLATFFGCPVVNEYGCTESGIVAMECEHGTMHLVPVATLAEIVQPDGTPTPPGETGEVVITDLYGQVSPLVRYRLHDLAIPAAAGRCACGRDLPAIAVQQGRVDSFIQTPHRGRVYDAVLAYTVPAGVLRFRVYQEAVDRLRAEIVPGPGFDVVATPRECQRRWEEALGPGVTVTVEAVDQIPLTAAGKLRYFVPLEAAAPPERPA